MADFGSVQHAVARQFQVLPCSLQALCQVCRQTAGWEMSEPSKLSTKVIPHSVNDFILLAEKCQSYPQKWSPTVSMILLWQISISFLKLLLDFIWGECEMCYSPPFLKLLNLLAWEAFIQVFSASMSSWITETKNGKRAKRMGPPLAQMQFWAKRVSSCPLMSHQLHRVTSGWITRSKFFYTSSEYKH